MPLIYAPFILFGFASGSVMYSYLLPKWIRHIDVRAVSDDGNPGAANAITHGGWTLGLLCLLCDLLKGLLPVLAACRWLDAREPLFALIVAAPVAGHAFSPLMRGHGGKAIAVAFGVLLGLVPQTHLVLALAGLYIFFSVVVAICPNRFRTVVVFGLFGIACFFDPMPLPVLAGLLGVVGIVEFRNIRLGMGVERGCKLLGHAFEWTREDEPLEEHAHS